MSDYLAAVLEMLGPAQNRYADPAAWDRLHAELGIELPPDYRALVDAFAPVQINGHLYLSHPATEQRNLGHNIRSTIKAWSEVLWDDLDADEDPRKLFGLDELSFGTRNGLWPIASTDRGETIFLIAASEAPRLLVSYDDTWAEHHMCFAEWLYRYLVGEDMSGPNSAACEVGAPSDVRRRTHRTLVRPRPCHVRGRRLTLALRRVGAVGCAISIFWEGAVALPCPSGVPPLLPGPHRPSLVEVGPWRCARHPGERLILLRVPGDARVLCVSAQQGRRR